MTLLVATPQAATYSNTAAASITDVPRAALWTAEIDRARATCRKIEHDCLGRAQPNGLALV